MTTTTIPRWLRLDTGSHPDRCGVCLEECLALLLDQPKTDQPDRVHPIIQGIAINANDTEPDPKKRRLLARTLACQVDTLAVDQEVTNRLAAFVCRFSAERLDERTDRRVGAGLIAAAECLENPNAKTRAKAAEAAEAAKAAEAAGAAWAAWAAGAAWAAWAAEAAGAAGAAEAAGAAGAAGAAWAAWAAKAAFYAELLIAVIVEFDRLTGRTECHRFTVADWGRVKAALAVTS